MSILGRASPVPRVRVDIPTCDLIYTEGLSLASCASRWPADTLTTRGREGWDRQVFDGGSRRPGVRGGRVGIATSSKATRFECMGMTGIKVKTILKEILKSYCHFSVWQGRSSPWELSAWWHGSLRTPTHSCICLSKVTATSYGSQDNLAPWPLHPSASSAFPGSLLCWSISLP